MPRIADDMLTVMRLIRESHCHPGDVGFDDEIEATWLAWHRDDPNCHAGR
jgi:hypothetical protein